MDVSPALLVDRVLQTQQGSTVQAGQFRLMKEAMNMQESAAQSLLNAVAGDLPLATDGTLGTQVNTMA
ncbi:putative motility protein [Hydrogenophaga sp. PAMC20947]|uniref:putative motility protein n=1 Tax=Hydrogenophaga sp. PAMC20947 TaxID=2565558 RepID=UPI00109E1F11|nr:putative motility protein [Hydrogenophaga sp. PAMC20947]QCB44886.1 putative motility protein [Hydrogenophaga sp. PAMC20947]